MGIDRSDITQIAYQEAERRVVTPAASSTPATAAYNPYCSLPGKRLFPNRIAARPTCATGAVVPRLA